MRLCMWFAASELSPDSAKEQAVEVNLGGGTAGDGKPLVLLFDSSVYAKSQRLLITAVSCQFLVYIPIQKY